MNKRQLEIAITSALVLALAFAWANSIKVLNRKRKQVTKPAVASLPSGAENYALTQRQGKENKWEEEKGLDFTRSPFSGKKYGEEEKVDFRISGIIWDEANPQVILNGKISRVGDSLEGFVIEKIERQKVTLFNGKKRIELNI